MEGKVDEIIGRKFGLLKIAVKARKEAEIKYFRDYRYKDACQ